MLDSIDSICGTLGASTSSPLIFETLKREVAGPSEPSANDTCQGEKAEKLESSSPLLPFQPVRVTDAEAVEAVWEFLEEEKMLIEPSCAVVVAGRQH